MTIITPGIDFIAIHAAKFLACSLLTRSALNLLSAKCLFDLPLWILNSASLLAFPLILGIRIAQKTLRDRRLAAAHEARLAPVVQGKLVGNLDVLLEVRHHLETGYLIDLMGPNTKECGPVMNFRVFWTDNIFTTCPEHIKRVLATDFNNYTKDQTFKELTYSVFGHGAFTTDGELWKLHRSTSRPAFSHHQVSNLEMFDRHASSVVSLLKGRFRTGHAIDFQDLAARFSLDSGSEFIFGASVHSLSVNLPYAHNVAVNALPEAATQEAKKADEFAHAFDKSQEIVFARSHLSWLWPLREIWGDSTKRHMKFIHNYLDPIIQEAIRKKTAGDSPKTHESAPKEDIQAVESLLNHKVKKIDDPLLIRDSILNNLFAARDTTTSALTFTLYLLSIYPEVLVRLRAEILAKVGPTRCPNCDDIKDMKYLRAVIDETLRLFPSGPFNQRQAINDTLWPSPEPGKKPIFIPGGTPLFYSVFFMHRRKDLWGPDAEEFDPDRFLDERYGKYLQKNPFIFLPFNAGPRTCLGQQYAYNQMSVLLVRILQTFSSITLDEEACPPEYRPPSEWKQNEVDRRRYERVWPRTHLTMFVAGGLWLKMKETSDDLDA